MQSAPTGGVNIDDLVKKIDAKIAELEKEEQEEEAKRKQEEQNKKEQENKEIQPEIKEEVNKPLQSSVNNEQPVQEQINTPKAEEKPLKEIKKDSPASNIAPTMFSGFMNKIENAMEEESKQNENITVHKTEAPEINNIPHKTSYTQMQKGKKVKDSEVSKYAITDDQFFDDFFDE